MLHVVERGHGRVALADRATPTAARLRVGYLEGAWAADLLPDRPAADEGCAGTWNRSPAGVRA